MVTVSVRGVTFNERIRNCNGALLGDITRPISRREPDITEALTELYSFYGRGYPPSGNCVLIDET